MTEDEELIINVVTGGGTGIGRAVAAMLPKDEQVIITGRRMDKLNQTVGELNAAGSRALAMTCDVSSLRQQPGVRTVEA